MKSPESCNNETVFKSNAMQAFSTSKIKATSFKCNSLQFGQADYKDKAKSVLKGR